MLRRFRLNTPALSLCSLLFIHAQAIASPGFSPVETPQPLQGSQWPDHGRALCEVANETLRYLQHGSEYDPDVIHGGKPPVNAVPQQRLQNTLAFICEVVNADLAAARPSRLSDPAFIASAFEWVRWTPDHQGAAPLKSQKPLLQQLPDSQLLITKYYVRKADGSRRKSDTHPQALYGLPFDETDLTLEQADAQRNQITRYRFGKQAIVRGALEQNPPLAPPLIWLSRADLEGALLQGTAVVNDDGEQRYFNVHRVNGIAYDRRKKPEEQERYWYFKEVPGVLGYGKDAEHKIPIQPQVTVAGDLKQLGLGRLLLLQTQEHGQPVYRLTILADTGGAFDQNLFQLDWLSGYYHGWADYHAANKHISDYANVWLLLKKE